MGIISDDPRTVPISREGEPKAPLELFQIYLLDNLGWDDETFIVFYKREGVKSGEALKYLMFRNALGYESCLWVAIMGG
jgi:hypothetical protein